MLSSFQGSTARKWDHTPIGDPFTIRFPHPGWFLTSLVFRVVRITHKRYPRTSADGTRTSIVTDKRGRVTEIVFEESMHVRTISRR